MPGCRRRGRIAAGITAQVPGAFVEVSPDLACERGLTDGTVVRLVSRHGAVRLPALVTSRVQGQQLYVPMNSPDAAQAVNRLTGSHTDPSTHTGQRASMTSASSVTPTIETKRRLNVRMSRG